jgi:hypothetical protein
MLVLSVSFFLFSPINVAALPDSRECINTFIEHSLPHTTVTRSNVVRFYESNGSGVAINDLNHDGLLDIVLGNLNGPNTILWNEGALSFRAEEFMPTGRTRAVNIVDVDGDGWLDIVVTTQWAAPRLWRNNGNATFSYQPLVGVDRPAYAMQWADVDTDGDLDLVTASYDAELLELLRDSFLFGDGAGVVYYENQDGALVPTRLADESQALAISLSDLDANGSLDLVVGNDFNFPDQSWSYRDGVWQATSPFTATTYSTMSFDMGDMNNDGAQEFFAADMFPYEQDSNALRAWQPVLDGIADTPLPPDNRQIFENVLLFRGDDGLFTNRAAEYGVSATGWSWSSKFGDLNNDGFLDLYVVNGMIAQDLFARLPNDELVEANQAFRNDNGERFVPAPEWGLGSLGSGRGMSMADLDNDGDLDVVVNNLNAPAQLFENDLCGGSSLQVELRWPGSLNPYGLGAMLALHTDAGTYMRDVRAASGYLSGDPARVHFGLPEDSHPLRLEVYWPDGSVSTIDTFGSERIVTVTH